MKAGRRIAYQFIYFVRTALQGFVTSPVTSGVAVTTIGVTLVLGGAFALLLSNMEDLLERFDDDVRLTAYLVPGLSPEAVVAVAKQVEGLTGVAAVRTISADLALERFERSVGGGRLLDGLDDNPLPASLEVALTEQQRSAARLDDLIDRIDALPEVDDIASSRGWVESYLRMVSIVRSVGVGLGVILALATLLIVANTIRLGIFARRDELEILSLVGASPSFVRAPFLLEGAMQGGLGGAIALTILFAVFRSALPSFEFGLELLVGSSPRFFSIAESLALIGGGAGLGLFGSAAALTGWRA